MVFPHHIVIARNVLYDEAISMTVSEQTLQSLNKNEIATHKTLAMTTGREKFSSPLAKEGQGRFEERNGYSKNTHE
jgi:hypothetical protein